MCAISRFDARAHEAGNRGGLFVSWMKRVTEGFVMSEALLRAVYACRFAAIVLAIVCLLPVHAAAAIYRCTSPGKPDSYQSTPCESGSAQTDLSGHLQPADPLTGEFIGRILKPKPGKGEDDRIRFRFTHDGDVYHASALLPGKGWQPIQTTLMRCASAELKGFLGEHWTDFDPVGLCAHGFILIHSRRGSAMPELGTKDYALVVSFGFYGSLLELEKVR